MNLGPFEHNMSHRDIAKELNMSRGMVNYYEKKAIEKIKKELQKRGITFEDLLDRK